MTVGQLRNALQGMNADAPVVFQGNTKSEEDGPNDNPSYTIATGTVYAAFQRSRSFGRYDSECVIDCTITDSEGGIIPL